MLIKLNGKLKIKAAFVVLCAVIDSNSRFVTSDRAAVKETTLIPTLSLQDSLQLVPWG